MEGKLYNYKLRALITHSDMNDIVIKQNIEASSDYAAVIALEAWEQALKQVVQQGSVITVNIEGSDC